MYEYKMYAPRTICPQLKWKDVFLDLYGCRHLYRAIGDKNLLAEEVPSPLLMEILHGQQSDEPVLVPTKRSNKNIFQVLLTSNVFGNSFALLKNLKNAFALQ